MKDAGAYAFHDSDVLAELPGVARGENAGISLLQLNQRLCLWISTSTHNNGASVCMLYYSSLEVFDIGRHNIIFRGSYATRGRSRNIFLQLCVEQPEAA